MRFNSLLFLAFLLLAVALVWATPTRARRWMLLGLSYLFYASWSPPFLALLIGVGALNHWGAQWIVAGPANRARRGGVVLAANLLLLALFKYLSWLCDNVNLIADYFGRESLLPVPGWVLPLGISFYVFEGISYTVDIIRKRERIHSFWDFQLFIAFFPKLIAGPIMRAKELLPQIEHPPRQLASGTILDGGWLLITGLFLKIVLADGISAQVDDAFSRKYQTMGSTDAWLMAVAFGLQIYLDFSSYSRMAIGSARLLGIQLVDNFNYPYSATSPVDFWNRWHMSLSRWIRDYLFFPLVGKKATLWAMCRATLISMTLCGIWHGAGWPFVLWGFYHGVLIAGYHVLTYRRRMAPPAQPAVLESPFLGWARHLTALSVTFALVSFGWLFFRSGSMEQALGLASRALMPWAYRMRALNGTFYMHAALLVLAIWAAPLAARWASKIVGGYERAIYCVLEGSLVGAMVVLCMIYLRGQTAFIYFQF